MKNKIPFLMIFLVLAGCIQQESIGNNNDNTGPYINLSKYEFETVVGKPIDFSNISAYDDVDGLMPVFVKGYVNYEEVGEYYPILYSIDTSGNETEVPVTVYVRADEYVEPQETITEVPDEEEITRNTTCDKVNTQQEYACDVVLPEVANQYITLYQGENGQERCEEAKGEDDTCEVVYTNDSSFWGYGLKNAE